MRLPLKIEISGSKQYAWLTLLLLPFGILFSLLLIPLMALDPKSWRFNKEEARELLAKHLEQFKLITQSEVKLRLTDPKQHCVSVKGTADANYQIEVEALQLLGEGQELEIIGSIDDGRLRAFSPLSSTIVIPWDGTSIEKLKAV